MIFFYYYSYVYNLFLYQKKNNFNFVNYYNFKFKKLINYEFLNIFHKIIVRLIILN